jgi:kanamycin kinase
MPARLPKERVPVPPAVTELAGERPVRLVWANEIGGLTFAIGSGTDGCFVKWLPTERAEMLAAEAARLEWASAHVIVPRVLDLHVDEHGAWMATTPIAGENAVAARWLARPAAAVRAIGEGIRALHEALPAGSCPFSWSVAGRLADAERRAVSGELDPSRWHPVHRSLAVDRALVLAADAPSDDRLVVCHGDACAPNTLVGDDGCWSGHVDLGALGVGDRWADLAIATWSTQWNYGAGWERPLLDAYGIEPDPERTAWYRLLWDMT